MIIVSKEEGAKWPNLGSLTELRGFYGTYCTVSTRNVLVQLETSLFSFAP